MRQTRIEQVTAYWRELARAADGVPERAAIEPRRVVRHLPDMFVLERVDRASFRFRLAGTRLCALYGRELREHDFIRLWPSAQQAAIAQAMDRMLRDGEPAMIEAAGATLQGEAFGFDVALFPLKDESGEVTRVLGVLSADAVMRDRDPAILTSQRMIALEVAGSIAYAERASLAPRRADPPAEPASAFLAARPTKVPFLRVVESRPEPVRPKVRAAN